MPLGLSYLKVEAVGEVLPAGLSLAVDQHVCPESLMAILNLKDLLLLQPTLALTDCACGQWQEGNQVLIGDELHFCLGTAAPPPSG